MNLKVIISFEFPFIEFEDECVLSATNGQKTKESKPINPLDVLFACDTIFSPLIKYLHKMFNIPLFTTYSVEERFSCKKNIFKEQNEYESRLLGLKFNYRWIEFII